MRSFYIILLFGASLANASYPKNERVKRQAHRVAERLRYPTRTESDTQITADGVPIRSESYISSRSSSRTRQVQQPSNSDHGLSLYEDFVNDPWKPTQDLHSLVYEGQATRAPSRELRSGYQSSGGRDDLWNQGQGYSSRNTWSSSSQNSLSSTQRPLTHHRNDGTGTWSVSSRSGDHITYVKERQGGSGQSSSWRHHDTRSSDSNTPRPDVRSAGWREESAGTRTWKSNTQPQSSSSSYSAPPYGEDGDSNWIVESRSDGHVTYRRRNSQYKAQPQKSSWQPRPQPTVGAPVQRLGQGQNEVLARVVKTGMRMSDDDNDEDDDDQNVEIRRGGNSGYASYKSMQENYAHNQGWKPTLQLKSGDSISYRKEDGTEVVFPRFRGEDSSVSTRAQPTVRPYSYTHHRGIAQTQSPHYNQQEGDWRVVSKGDSHITWSRVGSEYDRSGTPTTAPYTYQPTMSTYSRQNTARPYHASPTQSVIRTHHSLSNEGQGQPSWRSGGPHYPMLHEKETDERARRLGASNTLSY